MFRISTLLTAAFFIVLRRNYLISYPFGSAPFYVYALERGTEFILPAAAFLIAGIKLIKKTGK